MDLVEMLEPKIENYSPRKNIFTSYYTDVNTLREFSLTRKIFTSMNTGNIQYRA